MTQPGQNLNENPAAEPTPRRKPIVIAAVAIIALLAAAGAFLVFTNDDDNSGSGNGTTRNSSNNRAADKPPSNKVYTEQDAQQLMLTLDDVPEGFSVYEPEEDSEDSEDTQCDTDDLIVLPNATKTVARYSEGMFGPFITQAAFLNPGAGSEAIEQLKTYAQQCDKHVATGEDGIPATYRVKEANYGPYGDDSYAFSATVTADGIPAFFDVLVVRSGNLVVAVTHSGIGLTDTDITDSMFKTVTDRL